MTARKPTSTKTKTKPGALAKPAPAPPPPTVTTDRKQAAKVRRGIDVPGPAPYPKSAPTGGKPGALQVNSHPDEDAAAMGARVCLSPVMLNLITAMTFTANSDLAKNGPEGAERLDVSACADVMIAKVNDLAKGGIAQLEQHLLCEVVALEAIFGEMARRAALNMGTHIGPMEVYMRLALKAQSQCRTTIDTLAEIKNPRPVYLNPKNVNNVAGNQQLNSTEGPQQVNNGAASPRVEEKQIPENKLLEAS
jgi:hypothetical protein